MKATKIFLGIGSALTAFSIASVCSIADTETYYSTVDSSSGTALASSLHTLSQSKHTRTLSYNDLWSVYYTSDVMPGTPIIWDIYSECIYTVGDDQDRGDHKVEGDRYNREHTTPQSWFNKETPMVADAHHIFATDAAVNGTRSNFPYGEVSNPTYTSHMGGKLGSNTFSGYNGTVFEPIDEYKGDVARAFMYMAIRYSNVCGSWASGADVVYQSSYPYLTSYAQNLFTKWAHEDPVSDKERLRNDAIEEEQGNRNPFVDHPEYVDKIWTNSYTDSPTNTMYQASDVVNAINALTSSSSADAVYLTYNKYCRLNTEDKADVTNAATLFGYVSAKSHTSLDLQEFWGNIISGGSGVTYTVDQAKVDNAIALINAIPDPVTLEAKAAVDAAKTAYYVLNKLEKAEVTNFSKLEAAMAKIAQLSVKTYTLITDASELGIGDEVIIVANSANKAVGNVVSNYYRAGVDITKDDDEISLGEENAANRFTLEEGTKANTFAFNNGTEYLASSANYSNLVGVTSITDLASWSISIDASGLATVQSNGTATANKMAWDSTHSDFTSKNTIDASTGVSIYRYSTGSNQNELSEAVRNFKDLSTKSSLKLGYSTFTVEEQLPSGYSLVSDVSELTNGSQIIITSKGNVNKAMNYSSGKVASAVDVTKSNGQLSNYSEAMVFTVVVNDDGTYSLKTGNQYLNSTAAKNISLVESITDNAKWSITISNNIATITNKTDVGMLQYNPSSPRFTTYMASSNQDNVEIYVGGAGGTVTKTVYNYNNVYLRFGTCMTKELYDSLVAEGSEVSFGVAISVDGTTYTNYACNVARVAEPFAKNESATGNYYQYFAKMPVPEANYNTVVYAKCYIMIDGKVYYTSMASYSVKSLAKYYIDNKASLGISDEDALVLGGF